MNNAKLEEVADGVFAYVQGGGWGFSNAGLVVGGGRSLLVDTLFDLKLTARMLAEMRSVMGPRGRIGTVVNTHANGDHCWGNQLVSDAEIVSSRRAAEEMLEVKPALMTAMVGSARAIAKIGFPAKELMGLLGRIGVPRASALAESAEFVVQCFGPFEYRGISLTLPTRTFDGELTPNVNGRTAKLIEVGPAHTKGDVIVHVPEARVAFTGDILFIGTHPIAWAGPVSNWIRACDRLLDLDAGVIVPGHGPITSKEGVKRTRAYWEHLVRATREGIAAGASAEDIVTQLASEYDWTEAHRLVVNVDTIRRELEGDTSVRDPVVMFAKMAEFERHVRPRSGYVGRAR